MAIFRVYPSKDTSLADLDGQIDTTGSNVGASEILNLYRTSDPVNATASIAIAFDIFAFPSTGSSSASYFLKMFDAQHLETIPADLTILVGAMDQSWSEGTGHDMDTYTDLGAANWLSASEGVLWNSPGAYPGLIPVASATLQTGHEDLEVVVPVAAEGYALSVSSSGDNYIKKFHSRHTHFPQKRPFLELRWDDATGSLSTVQKFQVTGSGPWSGSLLDRWDHTGSMSGTLVSVTSTVVDPTSALIFKMPNLKRIFNTDEVVRLEVNGYEKDFEVATVAAATADASPVALLDAYYRVVDDLTGDELVPFGTGSLKHTKLSYADTGNYFTFYMSSLPTGRVCRFDFTWQIDGNWYFYKGDEFKFGTR